MAYEEQLINYKQFYFNSFSFYLFAVGHQAFWMDLLFSQSPNLRKIFSRWSDETWSAFFFYFPPFSKNEAQISSQLLSKCLIFTLSSVLSAGQHRGSLLFLTILTLLLWKDKIVARWPVWTVHSLTNPPLIPSSISPYFHLPPQQSRSVLISQVYCFFGPNFVGQRTLY